MKKIYYWLCIVLMGTMPLQAQNLVTNPGFEDTTSIPWLFKAIGWNSATDSPDLFCPGHSNPSFLAPNNFAGYQQAYDGTNYGGLFTFVPGFGNPREFLQNQLTQPLQPGTTYYFSAYISRSDYFWVPEIDMGPASNKFGVRFSVNPYSNATHQPAVNNFAHIYSNTVYMDKLNWSFFSGSFVADSAYKYMTLGNFFQNEFTDTVGGAGGDKSYYYIDHVCLSPNPLTANEWYLAVEDEEALVGSPFPNPCYDELNIKAPGTGIWEITIYNHLAQVIYSAVYETGLKISTGDFTPGMLFYEIRNTNGKLFRGKILKM